MKRTVKNTKDVLDLMVDVQEIENGTIEYTNSKMPGTRNTLTKAILQALKLEAQKHCLFHQMIVDSLTKEAVHLSPEELGELSMHINKYLDTEEKVLSLVEAAEEQNEPFIAKFLFSYLISDLKKQNDLLREFDDELKAASIPTSVSARRSGTARGRRPSASL